MERCVKTMQMKEGHWDRGREGKAHVALSAPRPACSCKKACPTKVKRRNEHSVAGKGKGRKHCMPGRHRVHVCRRKGRGVCVKMQRGLGACSREGGGGKCRSGGVRKAKGELSVPCASVSNCLNVCPV